MADDAALLEADRRARSEALDVRRSFVVQAPAGSGKTELLIQRYLKLLAEVDNPEEVVAITFTRKAAQEMRSRALAAIREVKESAVFSEQAHHRVTQEAARKVRERDSAKGWKLLDSPHRMRIQTLDALNAGIARSLPFSSGFGIAGRIVTDDEMRLLYRSAAGATLDWLLTEGPENAALEQVLLHLDNNTTVYMAYVARMLASRDRWASMIGSGFTRSAAAGRVRQELERNIAAEITAKLGRVRRLLPDRHLPLLVSLCRYAGENRLPDEEPACTALAECEEFPPADASHIELWRAIAALLLTQTGNWRKSVTRNDGFPRAAGQKQQMLELLGMLSEETELAAELHRVRRLPDPRYSDSQWQVLLALFRLLPLAVAELRRLFSERGVTDHTQVAEAASLALGHPDNPGDVGLLLDFTIRHLLIDEMQDTSLAQYRFIERLVAGWEAGDGRTLFCVGDPMQSIYRFRDAEVGQFLVARERGIGPVRLEPLVLRQNFRSGEHLVHWYNSVFGQILPERDDVTSGAIAYAESVPVPSARGNGVCRVYPLFGVSYEEEAGFAVDVIRGCVHVSGEQTAVLVRSRTQLPLLLKRLRDARIAYRAVEIDRLTDLPEVIDLLALTRALAHRGDRIAWLGLLRGPWVGLGWDDLHALVFNDTRSTVPELLHDEERLAALSPEARISVEAFRETIAPLLAGDGMRSLRESVERAWFLLRGPMLLRNDEETDNVYRFLDVLETLDTAGTLHDVAELEAKLDQVRVSGKAAPDCRLHVMTMHKAKGLQFDHVVLYGLGRTAKGDEKSILSWLNLPERDNAPSMIISPVGRRADLENDSLHNFIEAAERDKARLEQDRLLYVACTRARRSVHLIGHVALAPDRGEYRAPRKGTLLGSLWPIVERQYAQAFHERNASFGDQAAAGTTQWKLPARQRLLPGAGLGPAPEVPGRPAVDDRTMPVDQQVDYYWVGSTARYAGTILHRWLHGIVAGRIEIDLAQVGRLLPGARNTAMELGVPLQDIEFVCERAVQALRGILGDRKGTWILSGAGYAELPVTGVWRGGIASVVIDRVRIDDAGVHWIIDYKASTHEGAGLDTFLRQESERYRPQLAKYAGLYRNLVGAPQPEIRAALYFPMLQKFCEVPTA